MDSSTSSMDSTKNCYHFNKTVKIKYLLLRGFKKCIVCDKRCCIAKCSDCGLPIHPSCSDLNANDYSNSLSNNAVPEVNRVSSPFYDYCTPCTPSTSDLNSNELIRTTDSVQNDEIPQNTITTAEAIETIDSTDSPPDLKKSLTGFYAVYVSGAYENEMNTAINTVQSYIEPTKLLLYSEEFICDTLVFTIDDYETANVLKNINEEIPFKEGRKLTVEVGNVSTKLYKKISEAVASRYNPNTKHLDLSNFHSCQIFIEGELMVHLNRSSVLKDTLKIAAKYDIDELNLANNQIKLDEEIIEISKLFPNLKVLNLAENNITGLKKLMKESGEIVINTNPDYKSYLKKLFPTVNSIILGTQNDFPSFIARMWRRNNNNRSF